jgi:GNAT superfamily N-acetyltransferase
MLSTKSKTSVSVEKWTDCVDELETLFPLHWREIGLFRDEIQMVPDRERYAALEAARALLLITARVDEKLVGYFVAFLFPHMHYKGAGVWGLTDMYFVLPEHRKGAGLKLFLAFERECRARGVVQAVTSCKVHEDHTELLEKLGWKWTDKTFQKHLK